MVWVFVGTGCTDFFPSLVRHVCVVEVDAVKARMKRSSRTIKAVKMDRILDVDSKWIRMTVSS